MATRFRWIRWPLVAALLLGGVGACSLSMQRDGLFNNRGDEDGALADQRHFLSSTGGGPNIERIALFAMIRRFDGTCLTDEANWERVHLDQSIERFVAEGRTIACYVELRARWPKHFPNTHSWRLHLQPLSRDSLRVLAVSRRTMGMDL